MDLRRKAGLTMAVGALLFLIGCGGDDDGRTTNVVNTGTNVGTLANLELDPAPGAVFISKNTSFQLRWNGGTTPPPTFSVTLQRYKESNGSSTTDAQKTTLTREGSDYVWDLVRSNNTTLDSPGIYYVEIDAGEEQVLASYIISGERAEAVTATRAAATRAVAEPAAGDDAYVHVVNVGKR